MIEEHARVVAVTGGGQVLVEAASGGGCNGCGEAGQCGTALLGRALRSRPARLRIAAPATVDVGDTVILGLPEGALLRGALIVYILPLAALLAAASTASMGLALPEWVAILAGAIGFGAGALLGRRLLAQPGNGLTPVFLRRAPTADGALVAHRQADP